MAASNCSAVEFGCNGMGDVSGAVCGYEKCSLFTPLIISEKKMEHKQNLIR
jgi:hypothetical protein